MSSSDPDMQQDKETLEHLLGVVVESREKRCKQLRDDAHRQASEIIKQAYSKGRTRMHHHIDALREKYRSRVSSANARNQTLLRKQHHKEERAILDVAWPHLREAMLALWKDPDSRRTWLEAAIASASSRLKQQDWHIEHPQDMSDADVKWIEHTHIHGRGRAGRLVASGDIDAGIRIVLNGTVIDATLEGLLKQKTAIEATLIARIKQGAASHE
jgi:3',5'-cyclic AMP phosphodiesterase CpdA